MAVGKWILREPNLGIPSVANLLASLSLQHGILTLGVEGGERPTCTTPDDGLWYMDALTVGHCPGGGRRRRQVRDVRSGLRGGGYGVEDNSRSGRGSPTRPRVSLIKVPGGRGRWRRTG